MTMIMRRSIRSIWSWIWASVVPSIAGPKRPQDRVILAHAKQGFREALKAYVEDEDINGYDESVAESFPASDAPSHAVGR